MITRAYQNAKGERQEVTMSADAWEALSEGELEAILGFKKVAAAPVIDSVPVTTIKPTSKKKK